MTNLQIEITAQQLNPITIEVDSGTAANNPTPKPATNSQLNPTGNPDNVNWNVFGMQQGSPQVVVSSIISNPGTAPTPPASSPNVAPFTTDPAIFFSTARQKNTYEWPNGWWTARPYSIVIGVPVRVVGVFSTAFNPGVFHVNNTAPAQFIENLFYGTGPLYKNAGGFGSNINSGGTGPGQTYNANSFTPAVGFPLIPSNSSTGR